MDGLHSPRILVAGNLHAIRGHLRASPKTLGSGSPNFSSDPGFSRLRQTKRNTLPSFQRGGSSGAMHRLQIMSRIEQSKINSDSGALKMYNEKIKCNEICTSCNTEINCWDYICQDCHTWASQYAQEDGISEQEWRLWYERPYHQVR